MILFLLLALADAPPKGMSYVPASQIHGRTFTSPDGWFSIDAPGDDWVWLEGTAVNAGADPRNPPKEGVTWIAHNPHWRESFIMVESQSETDTELDDGYITAFEEKFRGIYARDDKTMSKPVFQRINLPMEGSLRYTYTTTTKSGEVRHHYGYVTGRVHRITLMATVADAVEPRLFTRAIVSLRWLKKP
jgi:hypothetical protein